MVIIHSGKEKYCFRRLTRVYMFSLSMNNMEIIQRKSLNAFAPDWKHLFVGLGSVGHKTKINICQIFYQDQTS